MKKIIDYNEYKFHICHSIDLSDETVLTIKWSGIPASKKLKEVINKALDGAVNGWIEGDQSKE